MSDDPFRDWLVDYRDHLESDGMPWYSVVVANAILARYDVEKAAAATDDAEPSHHTDTTETPRTGDPDDQEEYEAWVEYRKHVRLLVSLRGALWKETVEAINALPTPVKGGEPDDVRYFPVTQHFDAKKIIGSGGGYKSAFATRRVRDDMEHMHENTEPVRIVKRTTYLDYVGDDDLVDVGDPAALPTPVKGGGG